MKQAACYKPAQSQGAKPDSETQEVWEGAARLMRDDPGQLGVPLESVAKLSPRPEACPAIQSWSKWERAWIMSWGEV
eukprot:190009-Amphidinium_carterae.3